MNQLSLESCSFTSLSSYPCETSVATEVVLSANFENPADIWSTVSDFTSCFPVFIAEFVMFDSAVMPMTSSAENFAPTASAAFTSGERSIPFAASSTASRPLAAPSSLSALRSFPSVPRLWLTPRSNFRLSKSISTTRSSISVLICV